MEPFEVDREKAIAVCRLVRYEVAKLPNWSFEQFEETSCWAALGGWYVFFSWGAHPSSSSELICQLLRADFRNAYLGSTDESYKASLLWMSPGCLSITGHLLDEINVTREENFSDRISTLLQILESKGEEGIRIAWQAARNFQERYWARYFEVPWIENP